MTDLYAKTKYPYFVPKYFKQRKCFVLWRLETRKGRITKVPKNANVYPIQNASTTNKDHWSDYDTAFIRYIKLKGTSDAVNGLGIVLEKSMNIIFIDIDHCIDPETRSIDSRGKKFLQLFPNTYCELSQSGTGLHFFVIGHIDKSFNNRKYNIEMYSDARYCAFTGNAIIPCEPSEYQKNLDYVFSKYKTHDRSNIDPVKTVQRYPIVFQSDQDILSMLFKDNKYYDTYSGEWKKHYKSQSEADFAMCCRLAFWCECDQATIDRIFRSSSLFRNKWDEKHGDLTYGEITIQKACSGCQETYETWKRRKQNESTECILSKW